MLCGKPMPFLNQVIELKFTAALLPPSPWLFPKNIDDQKGPVIANDGVPYFTVTTKVKGKEVSAEIWDIASFYRETPNMRSGLPK